MEIWASKYHSSLRLSIGWRLIAAGKMMLLAVNFSRRSRKCWHGLAQRWHKCRHACKALEESDGFQQRLAALRSVCRRVVDARAERRPLSRQASKLADQPRDAMHS